VTISDGRVQTLPGWRVVCQDSDFTSGSNAFSGRALGWIPAVTGQNPAQDVVAGPPVAPGVGLRDSSLLATAAANHGLGTAVLGATLQLSVPATTQPGSYSAVLTVTAFTSA
jgi:hypothetical protein